MSDIPEISETKPSDKDSSYTKNPFEKVFDNPLPKPSKKIPHPQGLGRIIDTYA